MVGYLLLAAWVAIVAQCQWNLRTSKRMDEIEMGMWREDLLIEFVKAVIEDQKESKP